MKADSVSWTNVNQNIVKMEAKATDRMASVNACA